MKTSERLKLALTFLWDGRGHHAIACKKYICLAIAATSPQGYHDKEVWKITSYISNLLKPASSYFGPYQDITVESFLLRNGHITDAYFNRVKIQAYRKAWVEHLIKEFEAKGD